MNVRNEIKQPKMTDADATPLDWFFVDVFTKILLGPDCHSTASLVSAPNKKPDGETSGQFKSIKKSI